MGCAGVGDGGWVDYIFTPPPRSRVGSTLRCLVKNQSNEKSSKLTFLDRKSGGDFKYQKRNGGVPNY